MRARFDATSAGREQNGTEGCIQISNKNRSSDNVLQGVRWSRSGNWEIGRTLAMSSPERELEDHPIRSLCDLKYEHRADIPDRVALEKNFRKQFAAVNRVCLMDSEFPRLLDSAAVATPFATRER